ncbi:MAG: (E)-4-hydroxy-3-methylbut-2-enyl-diphosphate synthase [Bacteroidia bacterium]
MQASPSNTLHDIRYALSHFGYKRIPTREIAIGDTPVGGSNPIRIQSMTTTDTMDTEATVAQSLRMVEAGCEYVRITAPSQKEAHNLAVIKEELRKRGCNVPLVADIHFTPNAAEIAARIVEKVRVNPGNYADKKKFEVIEYTDESYQAEIDRIHERFSPLVKICKAEGTVMRIGTNHGSLSDRIMSRYGDTPLGMVESAMEFIRICEYHNFHDIVISMKASNPQVMVQAYRLLMQQQLAKNVGIAPTDSNYTVYPMHLGVTEAGEGIDGRIKSAIGISTLLLDGIGDTVRVSLTEEPEYEMPVAKFLSNIVESQQESAIPTPANLPIDPYAFRRRESKTVHKFGKAHAPSVVCDLRHAGSQATDLQAIGYEYVPALDKYNFSDIAADYVYLGENLAAYELPGGLTAIYDFATWQMMRDRKRNVPYFDSIGKFLEETDVSDQINFVNLGGCEIGELERLDKSLPLAFVIPALGDIPAYTWRSRVYELMEKGWDVPVILQLGRPDSFGFYNDDTLPAKLRLEEDAKTQLHLSASLSTTLVDGLVDGIWLDKADNVLLKTAFGALQMARLRITKTEYISCPSCGRTLFDLQETTAMIRSRTEHLKGVKIGIMGCIVNGPGEMADADYGYVGSGPGKITLYRGQEVVKRNVPAADAVDELIALIDEDGNWV